MLTGGCEQYCTIEEENLELEDSLNFLGSRSDRNCDSKKEVRRHTMIGRTAVIGLAWPRSGKMEKYQLQPRKG